jgi:aquaporin Z
MTVMAGAFAVGNISGGAFNPAVVFGITATGLSAWVHLWIYIDANFTGGAAAGAVFRFLRPEDARPDRCRYAVPSA